MENLELYEKVRNVPIEAQREITGGKLNGKTDINPMWRIKKLTEIFGLCGVGWKTKIVNKWLETGANGEIAAFVDIELYIKQDGQWSDAILGTGGSMLINTEKGKLTTNDECFKMAYTDAISVACKSLGFGADIYWNSDATKYTKYGQEKKVICDRCGSEIKPVKKGGKIVLAEEIKKSCNGLCIDCYKEETMVKEVEVE